MPTQPDGISRRSFVGTSVAFLADSAFRGNALLASTLKQSAIKAVAFDGFAIFDPRSVSRLAEELFPGLGSSLSDRWRTRQFEYTWLRNSMHAYADFWQVTQDALNYAAKQSGIPLQPVQRERLMAAYKTLSAWPDVAEILALLRKRGLRLAILSNMTLSMMEDCTKASGLDGMFDFLLSADRVQVYKPDLAAYQLGLNAFRLSKKQVAFVAFGGWDAAGAQRFGYPTYWSNRLGVPEEELGATVEATYPDLSSLPGFIDSKTS